MKNELLRPTMVAQTMANDIFLQQNLTSEENPALITHYLRNIQNHFGCSVTFVTSETSRRHYMSNGLVKTLDAETNSVDAWYDEFISKNVAQEFIVGTDDSNDFSLKVFINTRISDAAGNLIGVCGIGVNMKKLQEILNAREENYKIKVNLIDKKGFVQISSESHRIENAERLFQRGFIYVVRLFIWAGGTADCRSDKPQQGQARNRRVRQKARHCQSRRTLRLDESD